MNLQLTIIGAGGHGKVIADIAKRNGYRDIVFLDDNASLAECGGYPIVGTLKDAEQYSAGDFIVAIGRSSVRQRIQTFLLSQGMRMATLVHPCAVIGENVKLGTGTVVMAGAVVNPSSKIGEGCIINTCSSVDHDCEIGDYAHVSVGAHVAGTVKIGAHTWVGAGATISNNIEITDDCMIGAGAVVIRNLTESGTYVGIPVRRI